MLRDLGVRERSPHGGGGGPIRPNRAQPPGKPDDSDEVRKLKAQLAAERTARVPDAVRAEDAFGGRDLTEEEKMGHEAMGPLLVAQKLASEELVRCLDVRRDGLPHPVKLARKQKKVRDKQADVARTEGRVKDKEAEIDKAAAALEQLRKEAAGLAETLERQQCSLEELTADYDLLVDEERAARDGLGPAPAVGAAAAAAPAGGLAPAAAPPSPLRQKHANADARGRAARTAGISVEGFEEAWRLLLMCKLVDAAPEDSVAAVAAPPAGEDQDDPMAAQAALQLESAGLPRNPAFVRPVAKAGPALPPPGVEGASASGTADGGRDGSRSPRRGGKKQDGAGASQ